jgi:hypothetical protein
MNPEPLEPPPSKKHKNLYDSFVTARDRVERGLAPPGDLPGSSTLANADKPRSGTLIVSLNFLSKLFMILTACPGNTVYVYGYKVNEELLKTTFSQFGKIINISMEVEKVGGKRI